MAGRTILHTGSFNIFESNQQQWLSFLPQLIFNSTCLVVHMKNDLPSSSGLAQSLESVLGGHRPRAHTVGVLRVDQHGRPLPPVMSANSLMMHQDPRRFSEASIVPPPRPPPPNIKALKKIQRRPIINSAPGTPWPQQMVVQPPPQLHPPPQQAVGGSNLVKMSQLARSTPQLDEYTEGRERERERMREREKVSHGQNARESFIVAQVSDFISVNDEPQL